MRRKTGGVVGEMRSKFGGMKASMDTEVGRELDFNVGAVGKNGGNGGQADELGNELTRKGHWKHQILG